MSIEEKLKSKYIFVGGKGGVGKTVIASAIALKFAEQNKKTLIASFNPVHSLSTIFQQDLSGGKIKQINGVNNLYALEVEIDDAVEKYKEQISNLLREFLKWAEIPVDPKPFIDIATTNPAFQEAASFDKMMDIILFEGENYDKVIFDTAAVANAIRLIGLSKIYGLWLSRVIKSREETLSLRKQLSWRKDKVEEEIKKDPVLLNLLNLYNKYNKVRTVITDAFKTSFVFVTIPTVLSISVVKRFMEMVKSYEIPSSGVIVNMLIPEEEVNKDQTGFLKSKLDEQKANLELISKYFKDQILGHIRLRPSDVIGLNDLREIVNELEKEI